MESPSLVVADFTAEHHTLTSEAKNTKPVFFVFDKNKIDEPSILSNYLITNYFIILTSNISMFIKYNFSPCASHERNGKRTCYFSREYTVTVIVEFKGFTTANGIHSEGGCGPGPAKANDGGDAEQAQPYNA